MSKIPRADMCMGMGLKWLLFDVPYLTLLMKRLRSTNYPTTYCNSFSIILPYFKH